MSYGTRSPLTPKERLELARRFIAEAGKGHGVTEDQILGKGRGHAIYAARLQVYQRLRHAGLSTPQIGRLMERDHSTVVQALKGGDRWAA